MTRTTRRAPLVAALVVLVAGLVVVSVGVTPGDAVSRCPGDTPEGSSYRLRPALWPPATRECVVDLPSGARRVDTVVPWKDWLTVALIAAAAGIFAGARGSRRPAAIALCAVALFLAAVTAWFVEDAALWSALAVVTAMSLAAVWRAPARRVG